MNYQIAACHNAVPGSASAGGASGVYIPPYEMNYWNELTCKEEKAHGRKVNMNM